MKKALLLTPLIVSVAVLVCATKIFAVTYDITGNAAGSTNNITVSEQNSTNVNQSNQSNISNNVNSNCNTGGNSASQNTGGNVQVNSGDCSSNVNITNRLNQNQAQISCPTCPKASPTPQVGASPGPGQPGGPAAGGNGGGGGAGGAAAAGGGQVLGEAGVAENLALLTLGMTMVIGGLWQVKRILV